MLKMYCSFKRMHHNFAQMVCSLFVGVSGDADGQTERSAHCSYTVCLYCTMTSWSYDWGRAGGGVQRVDT